MKKKTRDTLMAIEGRPITIEELSLLLGISYGAARQRAYNLRKKGKVVLVDGKLYLSDNAPEPATPSTIPSSEPLGYKKYLAIDKQGDPLFMFKPSELQEYLYNRQGQLEDVAELWLIEVHKINRLQRKVTMCLGEEEVF